MSNVEVFYRGVPCNGCTLCCHRDAIRILPEDDSTLYQTEAHEYFPGELQLVHKPDGDCIYLGENGCTIHSKAPRMCLQFDCRIMAEKLTYTRARKLKGYRMPVWKKGRELLKKYNIE